MDPDVIALILTSATTLTGEALKRKGIRKQLEKQMPLYFEDYLATLRIVSVPKNRRTKEQKLELEFLRVIHPNESVGLPKSFKLYDGESLQKGTTTQAFAELVYSIHYFLHHQNDGYREEVEN